MNSNKNLKKLIRTIVVETLSETYHADSLTQKDIDGDGMTPSEQERFTTAIYLYYVELKLDREFKHVTKDQFYDYMEKNKNIIGNFKTVNFDLKRIYRLADEKHIWLSKDNRTLGEIWMQYPNNVASYWIKDKR